MKYYLSDSQDYGLCISMRDGSEEERQQICTLAENMFTEKDNPVRIVEGYDYHLCYLRDLLQFKRLIKWKSLFDNWSPNKGFSFLSDARKALKISREVLNNQVFDNEGLFRPNKDRAAKFEFN